MKNGAVGFHCNELNKYAMIDKTIALGKSNWRATEKGLGILQEVDKREAAKAGRKQVNKHVS